ncbi:MAG: helix-turn-helix domain-containing protein [Oscillospiraceae bacterium]|nr:helix-turn-helix domain-containing protein [Oscillospiraceae bacterium]
MLSENLLYLRKQKKLTQEQAAEKIGITRQALAGYENGQTVPDVEKCLALARLYDVSLDALVSYEQPDGELPIPPRGRHIFGAVTVGEKGQIVIPKKARDTFGLSAGDTLIVLGDEERGLALVKAEDMIEMFNDVRRAMKEREA